MEMEMEMVIPPSFRLDRDAYNLLFLFLKKYPSIRMDEIVVHGIDPFEYPDEFFDSELLEINHADLYSQAIYNRGVINQNMIEHWIQQEMEENEPTVP